MNNISKYLAITVLTLWTSIGQSQINPANNRLDKKGLRQGTWVVMLDSLFQETKDSNRVKLYRQITYKNNTPHGVTTEYYLSGLPYWKGKIIAEDPLQYDSTVEHYYPNGQVQYRYSYKNNQVNGKAYEYYEFGELKTISNYVEGKLDGPYDQYHINGNLILSTTYRFGQIDGAYTEYHSNGTLSLSGLMNDDQKEGEWTVWDNEGTIVRNETYLHNKLQPSPAQANIPKNPNRRNGIGTRLGTFTYMFDEHWDFTQNPVEAKYYRIITYKDNKPTGVVTDYYVSGKKQWEGKILSDIPDVIHGKSTTYYESGQIKKIEKYKKGKRHGKRTYYYEDGSVEETDVYKNGELNGLSILYYDNGVIKQKVNHVNGKQDGDVILNYKNGQPKTKGQLSLGAKNGKWTWYNEDGTVKSSFVYNNDIPDLTPKPITITEQYNKSRDHYAESGRLDSAIYFGRLSHKSACDNYGKSNSIATSSGYQLGKLYYRAGKIVKADSLFQIVQKAELKDGREKTYDHINTLRLLSSTRTALNQISQTEKLLLKQESLLKSISEDPSLPLASIYNDLGAFYEKRGEHLKANEYYQMAITTFKQINYTTGIQYSQLLEQVGKFYLGKNQSDQALYYFHEALTNYLTFFPNESNFNTLLLDDIGQTQEQLNHLEIAKRYYEEAMLVRKNIYGERHIQTAKSYQLLANIHSKLSLNKKAESLFLITLGIQQKTYGINSSEYLATNNLLAKHYSRTGDLSKSKLILENNLSIYKVMNNQVGLAETHLQLARIYHAHYEFESAQEHYLNTIEIHTKLGEQKVNLIDINMQLGNLYSDFKKYTQAINRYDIALKTAEDIYGKKSLKYAEVMIKLGDIYKEQGLLHESESNYQNVQNIIKNQQGTSSPVLVTTSYKLAEIQFLIGDTNKAQHSYSKALNILNELGSQYDELRSNFYLSYGRYKQNIGDYETALENFDLSKHIQQSNYSTKDLNYALTIYYRAISLINLNNHLNALEELLIASDLFKSKLGDDDQKYLMSLGTIANIYLKLNMKPDAESFLKMRYDAASNNLLPGHNQLRKVIKTFADFYLKQNEPLKSVPLYIQLLKNDISFIKYEYLVHDSISRSLFIEEFKVHIDQLDSLNKSINQKSILSYIKTCRLWHTQIAKTTSFNLQECKNQTALKENLITWEQLVLKSINLQNDHSAHYEEIEYLRLEITAVVSLLAQEIDMFKMIKTPN